MRIEFHSDTILELRNSKCNLRIDINMVERIVHIVIIKSLEARVHKVICLFAIR